MWWSMNQRTEVREHCFCFGRGGGEIQCVSGGRAPDRGKEAAWTRENSGQRGDAMSSSNCFPFPVEQEGGSKDRAEGIGGFRREEKTQWSNPECGRLNEQGKHLWWDRRAGLKPTWESRSWIYRQPDMPCGNVMSIIAEMTGLKPLSLSFKRSWP